MKSRKIIAIAISLMMCLSIIPVPIFASSESEIVTGKTELCGVDGYDFMFNFKNLTSSDNTKYNDQISILSSLLSTDFLLDDEIKVTDKEGYILEQLGFDAKINIQDIKNESKSGSMDKNDYVVYSMGRKEVTENGRKYSVYVLAIRGTLDIPEWASDLDFGADSEGYYNTIGGKDQTMWSEEEYNHNYHKGFDVTGNRILEKFNSYMEEYSNEDKGRQKTLLITGHSRGAAEADIIGKYYEDKYNLDKDIKPYTYTFGTPTTTTDSLKTAQSYKTIFNICNTDDLVPYVPLTTWQFKHYGTDRWLSVDNTEALKKEWNSRMFIGFTIEYFKLLLNSLASNETIQSSSQNQTEQAEQYVNRIMDNQGVIKYISGNGSLIAEKIDKLLPATSREDMFECSQLVWIPWNTPEKFRPYYKDAGYGSVEETKSELEYYTFALLHKAKRVRINNCFFLAALKKDQGQINNKFIIEENLDFLNDVVNEGAEQIDNVSKEQVDNVININKDNLSDELFYDNENGLITDVKVLAYTLFCQLDSVQESGDEIKIGFKELLEKISLGGLLCSHMPTTYYQIAHYMAVDNLESNKNAAKEKLKNELDGEKNNKLSNDEKNKILTAAYKDIDDAMYNTDIEMSLEKYKNNSENMRKEKSFIVNSTVTGDMDNIFMFIAISVLSLLAIVVMCFRKKY